MSDHQEQQYQLAVEWQRIFPEAGQQNRGFVFYSITLRPEVTPETLRGS